MSKFMLASMLRLFPLAVLAASLAAIPPGNGGRCERFLCSVRPNLREIPDQSASLHRGGEGRRRDLQIRSVGAIGSATWRTPGATRAIGSWTTRPRGLTLSMTAIGSDAKHSLSCIVHAPPRSSLTLDGAIAHIRAVMGLGATGGQA